MRKQKICVSKALKKQKGKAPTGRLVANPIQPPINYLYGPVPSRRLGYSLGVDLVPFKTCSFDCVYCQVGRTTVHTIRRKEYAPANVILGQIKKVVASGVHIDHISFSGSGEPTLNSRIGYLIKKIKMFTDIPVAVLTNGSLLHRKDVRYDLRAADVVLPTFDAATVATLNRVNRPCPGLTIKKIVDGLVRFRKRYRGLIWLELMLVKGLNDSIAEVKKMKRMVDTIEPDRIQLNTVIRPPADPVARPLTHDELEKIQKIFGARSEIVAEFRKTPARLPGTLNRSPGSDVDHAICAIVGRRPVTARDIVRISGLPPGEVEQHLRRLCAEGSIKSVVHSGKEFFEPN